MNKRSSSVSNSDNDSLRSLFKEGLGKLSQISTRQQAFKQLKSIILQNKTTSNLRIWLSVLNQNRNKHNQSEINIIGFIVEKYNTGLLDPLDKMPSLQKTTFRITELLLKFFTDAQPNVQLACQKAWVQIYLSVLFNENVQMKRKILFNNLQALINGGGGKISQMTASLAIEGLLQASLSKQDHQFFKQIAKRTLVLFLKTTIIHFSPITCLQSILSFFGINNLIPLSENICNKIISYISLAPPNSSGYKIKSECCNVLGLIGDQIDKNGLNLYPKIIKILEDLATDKVWAVQATGRKALTVWRNKKKQWENEFLEKQEVYTHEYQFQQQQQISHNNLKAKTAEEYYKPISKKEPFQQQFETKGQNRGFKPVIPSKTYQNNWVEKNQPNISSYQKQQKNELNNLNNQIPLVIQDRLDEGSPVKYNSKPHQQKYRDPRNEGNNQIRTYNEGFYNRNNDNNYLHKNTGGGGGNNVQTVENFYNKQKASQQTYARKMQQIKRSIYNQNKTTNQNIEYDETIPWHESKSLPDFNQISQNKYNERQKQQNVEVESSDLQFVQKFEEIIDAYEKGKKEQAVKDLLEMDDDIYFLRFLLQNGQDLLKDLTRPTSSKLLKKLLSIQKTNFMEQMFFKLVGQTSKVKGGQLLTNTQNLQIVRNLQKCQKMNDLQGISKKIKQMYEKSLNQ